MSSALYLKPSYTDGGISYFKTHWLMVGMVVSFNFKTFTTALKKE